MRTLALLLGFAFAPFLPAQEVKPLSPAETKAAFLKLLDRPKVKLDWQGTLHLVDYHEKLTFASEKGQRVPVLVVRPVDITNMTGRFQAPTRFPCVILLHGTGGTKESQRPWMEEFAKRGFVAIDARYHGERAGGKKGSEAYVEAITKAWQTPAGQPHEHPWFYDTCWDLWRLLDYLETREDVDPKRIGMIGTSMGGIQTWLAAACDDRVAAAAPLIAAQSLRWSLDNDQCFGRARTILPTHQAAAKDLGEKELNAKVCEKLWAKIVPGITAEFDCPQMLPLFAPRPLFLANGELDPNCPIEGAKLAIRAAEKAYKAAGAADKLEVHIAAGVAHKVTDEQHKACTDFMVKWLGNKP
jgi:dienelactone hydrolase